MQRIAWWIVLTFLAGLSGKSLLSQELADLRVSENGRFLVDQEGTGIFPLVDTAWAIAWQLDRGEVEAYLQHRHAQKFNMIALVAFPSYEDHVVTPNADGDQPFVLKGGKYDPLRPITTAGKDPADASQYDYWDHLEYIMDSAHEKNMAVIVLPAWGGCVAGSYGNGKDTSAILFDASRAYRYGNWLGSRFAKKRNVLWMMGGDRSAVYGTKDYRKVFAAMAEGLADGINGIEKHDGQADFGATLMSYHPQKWAPNSSEWFHHSSWLDFNSIQDQPSDQIASVEHDYGLEPAKPTWLFEGGYEHRRNSYTDWQIRFQSYQTVFAGGFGVTYGNMNIYHFSEPPAKSDENVGVSESDQWNHSLDDPGAVQMQYLLRLMRTLSKEEFLRRVPDQALIAGDRGRMTGAEGIRSSCLVATRDSGGRYAFVYSASGRPITVRMSRLSGKTMDAYWYDPSTGKWRLEQNATEVPKAFRKGIASGTGARDQTFDPPGSESDGNDWVLVLRHGAWSYSAVLR